jgi:hypothetical protein
MQERTAREWHGYVDERAHSPKEAGTWVARSLVTVEA